MDASLIDRQADAVRRFNRFYTARIGVLDEGLLDSAFTLTEVRVLYEIAHRAVTTATALAEELRLDQGYLSRILARFRRRGLVLRTASETDGRIGHLSLTPEGRKTLAPLEAASRAQILALLEPLDREARRRLVEAMGRVETLLGGGEPQGVPYLLRGHRPGDMGWIVHRQGVLYAEEYGWDETYEALVAEIVAGFLRTFDPTREACWIAERDGAVAGSVFLVRATEEEARLRLLYVEPSARGLGIGSRLVAECIAQARRFGYRRLGLWTNDVLAAARRIYEAAGFQLTAEERHRSFGRDLVGQTWVLEL